MACKGLAAVAVSAALCGWSAAWAHHSPAAYDTSREVVLEGTVAEVAWKNPHVYLTIDLTGPDGETVAQDVEAGPVSALRAVGLRPEAVNPGDHVRVRANPSRRGAGHAVLGLTLTTADGAVMSLRSGQAEVRAPEHEADGVAGVWRPSTADFFALANSRADWPLTDAGRRALGNRQAMAAAAADCSPFGAPAVMMEPIPTTIDVGADSVVMTKDGEDVRRVVHLDGQGPPADFAPTLSGYSAGRWRGDELVVETTGFAADPEGLGFALPSSAGKRVTERFRLSDDHRQLLYEATVEDPEYLSAPLTMSSRWDYRPDIELSGATCDLEAARRFLTEN